MRYFPFGKIYFHRIADEGVKKEHVKERTCKSWWQYGNQRYAETAAPPAKMTISYNKKYHWYPFYR